MTSLMLVPAVADGVDVFAGVGVDGVDSRFFAFDPDDSFNAATLFNDSLVSSGNGGTVTNVFLVEYEEDGTFDRLALVCCSGELDFTVEFIDFVNTLDGRLVTARSYTPLHFDST